MSVIFVTSIYDVYHKGRTDEIWERFASMASVLPFHIVCSAADVHKAPPGVVVHVKEFHELEIYKIINKTTGLPQIRNDTKDTKEFMILMNAKTECIKIVKEHTSATHYVWIDAGIGKIFKDSLAVYNAIKPLFEYSLKNDKILIPGCWTESETRFDVILTKINWRFSGGFFVVPSEMVDYFHYTVCQAAEEIRWRSGRAIWEVNVWVYAEQRIPIQWEYGGHDESIFNGLLNYRVASS